MHGQAANFPGEEWVGRYCDEWDRENRPTTLRRVTRDVYAAIWRSYLRVLADRGVEPASAGPEDARAFLKSLKHPTTRLRHGRLVKAICELAADRGDAQENPFEDLASLLEQEEEKPSITALALPDIGTLIAALPPPGDWKAHRDQAAVVLAAAAGLRLQEMRELEVHQIHPETVQPAGGTVRARVIKLAPPVRDFLQGWLTARRAAGIPASRKHKEEKAFAFPTKMGEMLPVNTFYRRIRQVLEQLYGKQALPHFGVGILRATFANTIKSPAHAQFALGHKQITSTLRYLDQLKVPGGAPRKPSPSSGG